MKWVEYMVGSRIESARNQNCSWWTNVRTAHGREHFEGSREVLVALADAVHLANSTPTIQVTGG